MVLCPVSVAGAARFDTGTPAAAEAGKAAGPIPHRMTHGKAMRGPASQELMAAATPCKIEPLIVFPQLFKTAVVIFDLQKRNKQMQGRERRLDFTWGRGGRKLPAR